MTTTIETPPTGPTPSPPRRRTAGHVVAIVVGCLLLLPGIALVVGGGGLAIAQAVATDDDGYFRFSLERVESDGVAVGTTDLWLDDADADAPWVLDWLDVDFRFRVDGAGPTDEVFVGIARTPDVERYLADASWSEVVEVDDRTPRYREIDGASTVTPPADEDFWAATVSGSGEQELDWEARGGRWSVVVMNADGASAVEADIEIGVRSGAVTPIAVTLLIVGALVVAGAVVLIVVGARGRPEPDAPTAPQWSAGAQPPPPAPAASFPPPAPDTVVPSSGDDDRAESDDVRRETDHTAGPS